MFSCPFTNRKSIETLRDKLMIKSEALNLLAKQIELCNKEKTDYKRLIDTLYDKNLTLKKSLYFRENEVNTTTINNNKNNENNNNALNSKHMQKNVPTIFASKNNNKQQQLSPNASQTSLFSESESEDYMKVINNMQFIE